MPLATSAAHTPRGRATSCRNFRKTGAADRNSDADPDSVFSLLLRHSSLAWAYAPGQDQACKHTSNLSDPRPWLFSLDMHFRISKTATPSMR
eukprot:3851381-Pyramimonas_sp.AAC.1